MMQTLATSMTVCGPSCMPRSLSRSGTALQVRAPCSTLQSRRSMRVFAAKVSTFGRPGVTYEVHVTRQRTSRMRVTHVPEAVPACSWWVVDSFPSTDFVMAYQIPISILHWCSKSSLSAPRTLPSR